MSYKVLTDGNGSGLIRVVGMGEFMPLSQHQAMIKECEYKSAQLFEVMAERDALAAQAATLLAAIDYVISGQGDYTDLSEATESTPQQCLAEIKAEAAMAGFIACAEWVGDSEYEIDKMLKAADEYAAKIRNTGTWLKDSNVNGGKRQGGEK